MELQCAFLHEGGIPLAQMLCQLYNEDLIQTSCAIGLCLFTIYYNKDVHLMLQFDYSY